MEQPQGVGTDRLEVLLRAHQVALRLRHLGTAHPDDALGEQPGEGLAQRLGRDLEIGERLGEEPRVHQMQDGVLDAADVLVDRQPALDRVGVEGCAVVPRVGKAKEVPRRVDEGVHRVGLARRGPAADRTGRVQEAVVEAQRRFARGTELHVVGREHGQLVVRHGHRPVIGAVDDRDRTAPEALPR